MTTDHHMPTSNFPFLKKRSSWIEIQFAKCKGFFCLDMWVVTRAKTGRKNDFREYRSKISFVFLTTHKTVTHKLFHSPRSTFCIVTACAGGLTTTGRPSSFIKWIIIIVVIMICDPYFFLVRRDRENSDTVLARLRSGVR